MAKNVNVATMPETIATSSRALAVSSSNFEQLKKNLTDIYENRTKLRKQLTKVKFNYFITYIFSSSEKRQDKKNLINELAKSFENAYINLNFRKGMKDAGSWDEAIYYFQELFQCCKIWDLTSRQDTDKFRQHTQLCPGGQTGGAPSANISAFLLGRCFYSELINQSTIQGRSVI